MVLTCYRCGNTYAGINGKDTYCPSCKVEMDKVEETPKTENHNLRISLLGMLFPF
jgi:NMD protein affecting ribosome stability and mRNA decay